MYLTTEWAYSSLPVHPPQKASVRLPLSRRTILQSSSGRLRHHLPDSWTAPVFGLPRNWRSEKLWVRKWCGTIRRLWPVARTRCLGDGRNSPRKTGLQYSLDLIVIWIHILFRCCFWSTLYCSVHCVLFCRCFWSTVCCFVLGVQFCSCFWSTVYCSVHRVQFHFCFWSTVIRYGRLWGIKIWLQ